MRITRSFVLRLDIDPADRQVMVHAKPGERGATLLLVTFVSLFLLIPIVGLCIDGAYIFLMKARLSAAVDASALATGRSLNVGQSDAAQISNAIAMGQTYFKANFPDIVMNRGGKTITISGTANISVNETSAHVRTVTVTASANFPLFFMPILNYPNQLVAATGQATRRDANIMMVLDRSGSMNNAAGSCGVLVASAQNFVNQFVDGRDRLGVVTFQNGANVDYSPTLYFKSSSPSLNQTLGTLVCGGDTSTAQGLNLGYNQIQTAINQPGALNVLLLFTDGQPNTVVANFPIKTAADYRFGVQNTSVITYTPQSSCQTTQPLTGAISDATTETATSFNDLNATGATWAIFGTPSIPISTPGSIIPISNAAGCSFAYNVFNGRQDVAYIPTKDAFQNSTIGLIPLDYFPSWDTYHDQIRPDMPRTIRWAAFNAADSQAYKIRNDTTYNTIVYTIGLQGNEPMAIYQDFMERMANDPRASNYDSTRPQGQFILANDTSQLSQAFQQVASQILRLSK